MSVHINTATWPVTVSSGGTIKPGGTVELASSPGMDDQALIAAGHLTPITKTSKPPAAARGKE